MKAVISKTYFKPNFALLLLLVLMDFCGNEQYNDISLTLIYSMKPTGSGSLNACSFHLSLFLMFLFYFYYCWRLTTSVVFQACHLPVCLFTCHILPCNSAHTNAEWNARSNALYDAAAAAWWVRLQLAVLQMLPMWSTLTTKDRYILSHTCKSIISYFLTINWKQCVD